MSYRCTASLPGRCLAHVPASAPAFVGRNLPAALNGRSQHWWQDGLKAVLFLKYGPESDQTGREQCWMGKGTGIRPVHKHRKAASVSPAVLRNGSGMHSGLLQGQWKQPRGRSEKSNFWAMTRSSLSFWGLGKRIVEEHVINALSLGGRKHDCAFFPSSVHHLQWCSWGSLFLHVQHLQN